MADDKTLRSPQDSSRIALGEDYEVEYWTKRFGVSREKLANAVKAVGNGADAVGEYRAVRIFRSQYERSQIPASVLRQPNGTLSRS